MFVASEDYNDVGLKLDDRLIRRPAATFFLRAAGSAPDADIKDGDLLIVDRAEPPAAGRVVVAVVRGEMLTRRLPPGWREDDGLEIWGVVLHIVRAP
ncbi:MAG: S24 family peptidase [Elusimicrobiota bacterium]|nr:S24 family peptidase [Elusimicrobiota bacterium]